MEHKSRDCQLDLIASVLICPGFVSISVSGFEPSFLNRF